MAHHRSTDRGASMRGRGVSRGLVGALLTVVLVAAVVVVWFQLGDRIDRQGEQAAGNCVEGRTTVPIIADPDVADALSTIAAEYSKTGPVVRDHCVVVEVRPGDAKVTLDGLAGAWDPAALGARPAAWVPQSSIWAADLVSARPDIVDGTPSSLVSSPVVLATAPELAEAFDGELDWQQLPTLQQRDASLGAFGLGSWGSIRLAMPIGAQSDATALAAQAVAMQVTRTMGPLTEQDADSPRVASSIEAMSSGAPQSPDGTPVGAARLMADASDPADATIHAVAITEQSLYQLTRDDTTPRLAEVIPGGPTPIADYPIIRLTGDGVAAEQTDAVAEFFAFASQPEHLATLTALGFRGDAPMPEKTATVTFPLTENPMPIPETAATVTINRLVYGPDSGPVTAG
ncbi:substrate-binding domain-containing protein [Gordonia sp. Z-3]|uniref:substrate-binding domain-containing protein n=1 Tax=Gordonia sp. Z-3 TaxID=3115408 RepID=UPI002E2A8640|nr:substrate-binding domain-containing protein [Gordonia sp. Z-3]MED5801911.1 substrate-binding domain-containing protein [Gordonia sp. Z-3]